MLLTEFEKINKAIVQVIPGAELCILGAYRETDDGFEVDVDPVKRNGTCFECVGRTQTVVWDYQSDSVVDIHQTFAN